MYSVSQTKSFEAAHYIQVDESRDCYKQVHGHSFVLTVTCCTEDLGPNGWVMDLGTLAEAMDEITGLLDHKVLNDIEGLEIPSFENIMKYVYDQMVKRGINPARIDIARPTLGQSGSFTP